MDKIIVKIPFKKTRKDRDESQNLVLKQFLRRSDRIANSIIPIEEKKTVKVSSKERVKKHREKIKANDESLLLAKEKKRLENQRYRLKLKARRESNSEFNEQCKLKNSKRMKKLRKKWAKQANTCNKEQSNETTTKVRKGPKIRKQTIKVRKASKVCKLRKGSKIRKCAQRAKVNLPKSSDDWAKAMEHIIRNATPKRKSLLSVVDKDVTSSVDEIVQINRVGRPTKENEAVKRKLAFSKDGTELWSTKKSLDRYKKRKSKKPMKSRPDLYKESWEKEIEKFLESNSRVMPNKKDTILVDGVHVAKRHLLMSKVQLFRKFKKENPSFLRRFTTFMAMIPKYYKCLDLTCRRVCVCTKDYNIEQIVQAINKKATENNLPPVTIKTLSDKTLCPYEEFPKRECIDRKCCDCGVEAIEMHFEPLIQAADPTQKLKYHQWKQVPESYTTKDGTKKSTHRWIQAHTSQNMQEVVGALAEQMKAHSGHMFRAKFQQHVQNKLHDNLPIDQCVVVVDFSENISLVPQDEIESAHWTTKQVTLYPIHITRHAPESTVDQPKLMKESLVILSDHLFHNANAVYVFTEQLIIHLQKNPGPEKIAVIHRFSDNCATQFKSKDAFGHISSIENTHDVKVIYHYTESGHGKGPSDGLGAAIKKRLERMILGGYIINNAYQAYLALVKSNEMYNQRILYIPEKKLVPGTAPKNLKVKTIKGTQTFHMVRLITSGPDILECRDLGCYCKICLEGIDGVCPLQEIRLPTKYINLETGKEVPISSIRITTANSVQCTNNGDDVADEIISSRQGGQTLESDGTDQVLVESEHLCNQRDCYVSSHMSEFARAIAVKGWKIGEYTPEDGNCFFHSICSQLNTTHTDLRTRVVNFMKGLPQEKQMQISQFLTTDFDTYLTSMSNDGTYVDHVILQNLSNMIPCKINVVQADPNIEDLNITPEHQDGNLQTVYVGYLPELQHYVQIKHLSSFYEDDFVTVNLTSGRRKATYIAKVLMIDEDVQLKFLKACGTKGVYTWPEKDDISWEPRTNIIKRLQKPVLLPGRGIKLKFDL